MTTIEATSEVFITAFRALPKKTREAVVGTLPGIRRARCVSSPAHLVCWKIFRTLVQGASKSFV